MAHARYAIGASAGAAEGSLALQDTDALNTMSVDAIDKISKVFVKVNNNTPAVDAEADSSSLDAGGFALPSMEAITKVASAVAGVGALPRLAPPAVLLWWWRRRFSRKDRRKS